jgi:uncharacterized protein
MTYLLDVNSLLALGVRRHVFHNRVLEWIARLTRSGIPQIGTCSITELGFVRVLSQARQYGFSVVEARELLLGIKAVDSPHFVFIPDEHDISRLPSWVKQPNQTTDGHLVELANANGAQLATLDEHIYGAYLIPQNS